MKRITFFCLTLALMGICGCAIETPLSTGNTTTEVQSTPVDDLECLTEYLGEYAIVYSCRNDEWNTEIQSLVDYVQTTYQVTIPVVDDVNAYYGEPIKGIEGKRLIFIGNVRHDIVKSYAETLSKESFLLTVDDEGNIIVLESNDAQTTLALESLSLYLHNGGVTEWQLTVPEYVGACDERIPRG